jgi:hypothetical protein
VWYKRAVHALHSEWSYWLGLTYLFNMHIAHCTSLRGPFHSGPFLKRQMYTRRYTVYFKTIYYGVCIRKDLDSQMTKTPETAEYERRKGPKNLLYTSLYYCIHIELC